MQPSKTTLARPGNLGPARVLPSDALLGKRRKPLSSSLRSEALLIAIAGGYCANGNPISLHLQSTISPSCQVFPKCECLKKPVVKKFSLRLGGRSPCQGQERHKPFCRLSGHRECSRNGKKAIYFSVPALKQMEMLVT